MSLQNIDAALITAYQALALGLATAYEGQHFTPPANTAWAAVFILPAESPPATLGVGGQDRHRGIMQIDFNVPSGTGRAGLYTYAQAVRDGFVAGESFGYSGQYVTVESTERTPIREVGGWLRITLNVNWVANTTRPEI